MCILIDTLLGCSSGSIVSDYGLDDRAIGVRSPAGAEIFPLASVSRPALGPTQPPVQWLPGVLSPGVKRGPGVMLTTHPHLVPRSLMSRYYTSSPPKRLHGVYRDCFTLLCFAWLKYFTYHSVPVLAPNYKQHILSPANVRKVLLISWTVCQMCLFEFIRVEGGATFMKYFKGGRKV
jgi:hypothetical protein